MAKINKNIQNSSFKLCRWNGFVCSRLSCSEISSSGEVRLCRFYRGNPHAFLTRRKVRFGGS